VTVKRYRIRPHPSSATTTAVITAAINKEMYMQSNKPFPGVGHLAITVSDLKRSVPWYSALFGSEPVLDEYVVPGEFQHTVFAFESGQLFGLHQHTAGGAGQFGEHRAGLDHVAFAVTSREELQEWESRLDELGVKHGGIVDAHYGSGLSFRDPDNVALEFFAPPA
jgi:catechol 2,3-dioxygenase-like lactoylglutathione lyase family enzyme